MTIYAWILRKRFVGAVQDAKPRHVQTARLARRQKHALCVPPPFGGIRSQMSEIRNQRPLTSDLTSGQHETKLRKGLGRKDVIEANESLGVKDFALGAKVSRKEAKESAIINKTQLSGVPPL